MQTVGEIHGLEISKVRNPSPRKETNVIVMRVGDDLQSSR